MKLYKPFFQIIILIITIAFFLRIIYLGSIPPGFFRDEAAKGYNSYCIFKTGRDIDGKFLPLFTRELITYNSALYSYLIIPFIILFDCNEISVRLPAVLCGTATVLALYWLISNVYNKKIACIAAFLLAISPWHLLFSRWANQGILLPFFTLIGLGFWLKGIASEPNSSKLVSLKYTILSSIFFAFTFYTYDIAKVFTPLFLFGVYIFYFPKLLLKNSKYSVVVFKIMLWTVILFLLTLPVFIFTIKYASISQARFRRISVFSRYSGRIEKVISKIYINWASHYGLDFLFLQGDSNFRHSVGKLGQLYLAELPLLILGIYYAIKQHSPFEKLLLYWLFIFPIPASLTDEGVPHALRSICGSPIFSIFSALGLNFLLHKHGIRFKFLLISIIGLLIVNAIIFFYVYFFQYPIYAAPAWEYGYREAIHFLEEQKKLYKEIIFSSELPDAQIFFFFYTKTCPYFISSKYRFCVNLQEYFRSSPPYPILALARGYEFKNYSILKEIYYPDGRSAFQIITNHAAKSHKN